MRAGPRGRAPPPASATESALEAETLDLDLAAVALPEVELELLGVLADEADEKLPFTPTLTASTGRLIELIRRCATQ